MILAVAALTVTATMANAAVLTTVTQSVSAELVATTAAPGVSAAAASAVYELGSGSSFSIGGTFTVTLTNAKFQPATVLGICDATGAQLLAAGSSNTSGSGATTITMTASSVIPAFTAYQIYASTSGTSLTANTSGTSLCIGANVSPPVYITGTSPVTIQVDSANANQTANAATLYATAKQFYATLTAPVTAVIDFSSSPSSTAFVAVASSNITTSAIPAVFVVQSDESLSLKAPTTVASNTSCSLTGAGLNTVAFPVTVTGGTTGGATPFTELATVAGSVNVLKVAAQGGATTTASVVVTTASTSATTGFTVTGANVLNICGKGAAAALYNSTSNANTVILTKASTTSVPLVARDFKTQIDVSPAASATAIFNLLPATLSHSIVLNTTQYIAPTIKHAVDGTLLTWFKLLLKTNSAANTASVNMNVVLSDGTLYTLQNFKTLTKGVTTTISSQEIVDALTAAGKTPANAASSPATLSFAGSVEIQATADNLYVYASQPNNASGSYTRIPLRVLQGGVLQYVQ